MRGLVIDTALGLCTVAAFEDGRLLAVRSEAMTRGHQERLGGFLRDVAERAGGFAMANRIGVTVGPGSFTGLRVGLAFAQGLGAALDRPVVGISALDALAASAPSTPLTAALIDARRGQVYARFWRDGVPTGEPEALTLEDAAARIAALGAGVQLVGTGAPLLADRFPDSAVLPLEGPLPEALAALTAAADPTSHPPRPLYLRAPDATPPTRLPGQPRPDRT
ncbi:MAG: tRNA (adenosine(37)-N6)-threonylcarbamoyltransferase complex dimerization subunit type 1 TsaB [Pseudomonadota bacterium]